MHPHTSPSAPRQADPYRDAAHHADVFAVQALDDLTGHLIQQHRFCVPPDFLDWIGHEATHLTRHVVRRYLDGLGAGAALNPSRAEVTILRLVYQTVTPMVKARFEAMTATRSVAGNPTGLQAA